MGPMSGPWVAVAAAGAKVESGPRPEPQHDRPLHVSAHVGTHVSAFARLVACLLKANESSLNPLHRRFPQFGLGYLQANFDLPDSIGE
ncbi:Urease subunit alpha, partial [Frankliniella fusca]